jgi:hypothetical protein
MEKYMQKWFVTHKRLSLALSSITLMCLVLGLIFGFSPSLHRAFGASGSTETQISPKLTHFAGGFQIGTVATVDDAASDGVGVAFDYGAAFSPQSTLGQEFAKTHMSLIVGGPASDLFYYQCHLSYTRGKPWSVCTQDYPLYTLSYTLNAIQTELQNEASDTQIAGYWILDDWNVIGDPGGAASILPQVAQLVHSITGKATICGFGAELTQNQQYSWNPAVAQNFSPAGCDMVGLYIYSSSVLDPTTSPSTFDWSMSNLLPVIFNALSTCGGTCSTANGWDINKEPLIGIGQGWAGTRVDLNPAEYEIVPTADEISEQSSSFCQHGATGMVYYAWNTSGMNPLYTPANSAQMKQGVLQGITACQKIWHSVNSFAPTSGQYGDVVTVSGSGFSNASSVTFNGVAALTYTINSDTSISARVPQVASSSAGPICVTENGQPQCSSASFTNHPPAGAVYWVSTTGSDSNAGTLDQPFATLEHADSLAKPGTHIHVLAGNYASVDEIHTRASGTASAHIVYVSDTPWGAQLDLTSSANANRTWESDGSYVDIEGFDIQSTQGRLGLIAYGSGGSYIGNHVHNISVNICDPLNGGAGIDLTNSGGYGVADNALVSGNVIEDIGPQNGSNPACSRVVMGIDVAVSGNTMVNNLVRYTGGYGISLYHNPNNNIVANNDIDHVSIGIIVGNAPTYTAQNNTVSNNIVRDTTMYGIREYSDLCEKTGCNSGVGNNQFLHNDVDNSPTPWFLFGDKSVSSGNLSVDPSYVNYTYPGGDYHLQTGSPCIDAGETIGMSSTDFEGNVRPDRNESTPDIGAYEYQDSGFDWSRAQFLSGDFNGDGRADVIAMYNLGLVNGQLAIAAYEWLGTSGGGFSYKGQIWSGSGLEWARAKWVAGDFNGDGKADIIAMYDLGLQSNGNNAIAAYEWLGSSSGLSYQGQIWNTLNIGGFTWANAQFVVGDFNGDHKADIMAMYNLGVVNGGPPAIELIEWLGSSSGLTYQYQVWTSVGHGGFDWNRAKWVADDINGDGKADLISMFNMGVINGIPAIEAIEWLGSSSGASYRSQVWSSVGS